MQMSLLIKDKRRNEQKTPNTRAERFLHRMLFKVANEASAALFRARLFAVWVPQGFSLSQRTQQRQPSRAPLPSPSSAPPGPQELQGAQSSHTTKRKR